MMRANMPGSPPSMGFNKLGKQRRVAGRQDFGAPAGGLQGPQVARGGPDVGGPGPPPGNLGNDAFARPVPGGTPAGNLDNDAFARVVPRGFQPQQGPGTGGLQPYEPGLGPQTGGLQPYEPGLGPQTGGLQPRPGVPTGGLQPLPQGQDLQAQMGYNRLGNERRVAGRQDFGAPPQGGLGPGPVVNARPEVGLQAPPQGNPQVIQQLMAALQQSSQMGAPMMGGLPPAILQLLQGRIG